MAADHLGDFGRPSRASTTAAILDGDRELGSRFVKISGKQAGSKRHLASPALTRRVRFFKAERLGTRA